MVLEFKKLFRNFIKNMRGAILLEFAVSIPILILLVLGLNDIFKMAEMQDKTNLVAHEVISMIQNISQGRENRKITKKDLEYICRFANYSIYPGQTLYTVNGDRKHVYGHFPHTLIHYVRGENNGKATCVWNALVQTGYVQDDERSRTNILNYAHSQSIVEYKSQVAASSIYPKLTIKPGEVKIIIEEFIFFHEGGDKYPNGTKPSVRQTFGLYLLSPPPVHARLNNFPGDGFFHSVAIFTPKLGLFDEDGPSDTVTSEESTGGTSGGSNNSSESDGDDDGGSSSEEDLRLM